ncbi:MAG: sulfatase [Limisphaerales bacterium]
MKRLLLALLLSAFALRYPAFSAQPNVILFLVDDMGWMDTAVNGSKYYSTPNMERLAQRAMRFTDAYAQPLCSPTRASILTGKSPLHHGISTPAGHSPPRAREMRNQAPPGKPFIYPTSQTYLDPAEYTLAEALHDAGYRTAHMGKWHLGLTRPHWPEQQGFDVAFHAEPSAGPASYFSPYGVKPDGEPGGRNHVGTITDGPPGEYIADRLTDEAVKFITANRDRPFFLNLWHYNVHGPWGFKTNYADAFAGRKDPRGKQGNPIMAAMLQSMDESLGRLLDRLDELKLAENTIFIFFSDNGGNNFSNVADPEQQEKEKRKPPTNELRKNWIRYANNLPPTSNDPLRGGKGTLYEGGTRVPLMVAWPGVVQPGSTSPAIVHAYDLYPTLLDALGLTPNPKQKMDGISFVSALKQTGPPAREGVFNYFPHSLFGIPEGVTVRSGDWKLIRWFETNDQYTNAHELYNLKDDIGETRSLAAQMPEKVKQLDALITGFLATGDVVPKPNPAFRAASAQGIPSDPLQGWVAQNCRARIAGGALRIESDGGTPFLGMVQVKHAGPAVFNLRARSSTGGKGAVQWRTIGQKTFPKDGQNIAFELKPGEAWQDISVELPVEGELMHLRVFLPAAKAPVEISSARYLPANSSKPVRKWIFGAAE